MDETLRLVDHHKATWLYVVPTMMSRIWKLPDEVKRQGLQTRKQSTGLIAVVGLISPVTSGRCVVRTMSRSM